MKKSKGRKEERKGKGRMLLLPNVLITTKRSGANSQGGTDPGSSYLSGVLSHGEPLSTMREYRALPAGAEECDFSFRVDIGTDIVFGDVLTTITLLDGVTPWAMAPSNQNETLRVLLAIDGPPIFLPYREAFVKRFTAGGPVY